MEYKFKTNINCGNCVKAVKVEFDDHAEILRWDVDTLNPDKMLTVEAKGLSKEEVAEIVAEAGFTAQPVAGS